MNIIISTYQKMMGWMSMELIAVTAIVWDQIGVELESRQNPASFSATSQPTIIPSTTHMDQMMSETHEYHYQHLSGNVGMDGHGIDCFFQGLFRPEASLLLRIESNLTLINVNLFSFFCAEMVGMFILPGMDCIVVSYEGGVLADVACRWLC